MKESYLFDMSFNNIVFTGRNKAYGAYELRKDYSKHVVLAAVLAITIFSSGLGWPLLKTTTGVETEKPLLPKDREVIILDGTTILPPPPKEDPKPQTQAPPPVETKVKTIEYTEPKVVPNDHPEPQKDIPTIEQMQGAIISTQTQDGAIATTPNLEGIEEGTAGTGTGTATDDANTVHDYVADMPHFEGGEAGLMRYISKKIRYPRQAVLEQIEGVVVVSFVVNRYGKVTDATILKGLGYGTDEEALRVINSLPAWTPGRQNGKPVAVRYTLPIRFNMQR